ncbi:hypothetical protein AP058_00050 [Flavobacterium sp. TAB 87]|nr:hypothetical protein AP058_00050 [Flavobacterium sp. TAB 87]
MISFFFVLAIAGFMLKLPVPFRKIDKQLHASFYFIAAAFFNVLFLNTKILKHIIIFIGLAIFGFIIELGQAYSNKFFHKKIHGRFDIHDIKWNITGLVIFTFLWMLIVLKMYFTKKNDFQNKQF